MKVILYEPPTSNRIVTLDILRGTAVWFMILYHFVWDLNDFGFIELELFSNPIWFLARTVILSIFLFVAGISMVLAHENGHNWRAFWRRWIGITGGAVLISLGTLLVMPQVYVFFGVLHCIAVASFIALPFLKTNFFITFMIAVLFCFLPSLASDPFFNRDWLQWIGLVTSPPHSIDYVPIFPWAGIVLLGVACCRWQRTIGFMPISNWCPKNNVFKITQWVGQHSLVVYILHQPALIGIIGLVQLTMK